MSLKLNELLRVMVKAIVCRPDEVRTELIEGETSVIFELHVHADDLGRVIGKGAAVVKALRKIMSAAAQKLRKKTLLQIVE